MSNQFTRDELKAFIMMLIKTQAEGLELANQCKDLKRSIDSVDTQRVIVRKPDLLPETLPIKEVRSFSAHLKEEGNFMDDFMGACIYEYPLVTLIVAGGLIAGICFGFVPWIVAVLVIFLIVVLYFFASYVQTKNAKSSYQKEKKEVKKYNEVTRLEEMKTNKRINEALLTDWKKFQQEEDQQLRERLLYQKKLQANLNQIHSAYTKNIQLFDKMVGMKIVHKKYAGLSTLFVMWDLLDTGRTHSLERDGSDPGAYNMVDSQEYQKALYQMIDRNFSSVISELRTLKYEMRIISDQNNRMMGMLNDVRSGIENLSETAKDNSVLIEKQGKQIVQNTALAAYLAKQSAENTDALYAMELYTKRMNGELPANTFASHFRTRESLKKYLN